MRAPLSLLPLRLDEVAFEAGRAASSTASRLTIEAGPRTVILGPNGAGKSVLLRLCHGLLRPTPGAIGWNSPELPGGPRRQAMVFQRPVLLRRSALRQRHLCAEARGRTARRARASARSRRCARSASKLWRERPARVLSGGEQQRLALARVWALRPEVLFLDEPTASLDPGATHEIERIIAALHAAGTKIVLVTHNLGQAHRLADEILFLHQGGSRNARAPTAFSSIRPRPRPPASSKENCHGNHPPQLSRVAARVDWRHCARAGPLHRRRVDDLDGAVGSVRRDPAAASRRKPASRCASSRSAPARRSTSRAAATPTSCSFTRRPPRRNSWPRGTASSASR